jgi:hypothetical protein
MYGTVTGVERGVGIAGPVHRIVDQAEAEQDAVQEAELEAVQERPDQAVADRRDGVGQQDQEPREARRPDAGLIDQQRDRDRQHDLAHHRDRGEHQRVLDRDPEQRVFQHAAIVLPAVERELAAPQLRQPDLVDREVPGIEHRVRQDRGEEHQRGQVHRQRELPGRQFAPEPAPAAQRERRLDDAGQDVRPCAWRRRCP